MACLARTTEKKIKARRKTNAGDRPGSSEFYPSASWSRKSEAALVSRKIRDGANGHTDNPEVPSRGAGEVHGPREKNGELVAGQEQVPPVVESERVDPPEIAGVTDQDLRLRCIAHLRRPTVHAVCGEAAEEEG